MGSLLLFCVVSAGMAQTGLIGCTYKVTYSYGKQIVGGWQLIARLGLLASGFDFSSWGHVFVAAWTSSQYGSWLPRGRKQRPLVLISAAFQWPKQSQAS